MLSRIANNLFWMGRYIERIEHTARYTKVNYFSAMDAPISIQKEFVLNSILKMNGSSIPKKDFNEQNVLQLIAFDKKNPGSIISSVINARENARGARDIISTELWETINKYYHFVLNYNQELYKTTGLFDFTQNSIEQLTIVKGQMDATLVHNEAWSIIKLGLYLERAAQILRAIKTKMDDIASLRLDEKESASMLSHQLAAMMRGLESFDMSRKHYRRAPNLNDSLEFLLLNDRFPRSVLSCLRKVTEQIHVISAAKNAGKDSAEFLANKKYSGLKHLTIEEINEDLNGFINKTQNDIYLIGVKLVDEYFSF
jgi:uncharacterized alpha-E superfamily protein